MEEYERHSDGIRPENTYATEVGVRQVLYTATGRREIELFIERHVCGMLGREEAHDSSREEGHMIGIGREPGKSRLWSGEAPAFVLWYNLASASSLVAQSMSLLRKRGITNLLHNRVGNMWLS
jgi:hypothetical protein